MSSEPSVAGSWIKDETLTARELEIRYKVTHPDFQNILDSYEIPYDLVLEDDDYTFNPHRLGIQDLLVEEWGFINAKQNNSRPYWKSSDAMRDRTVRMALEKIVNHVVRFDIFIPEEYQRAFGELLPMYTGGSISDVPSTQHTGISYKTASKQRSQQQPSEKNIDIASEASSRWLQSVEPPAAFFTIDTMTEFHKLQIPSTETKHAHDFFMKLEIIKKNWEDAIGRELNYYEFHKYISTILDRNFQKTKKLLTKTELDIVDIFKKVADQRVKPIPKPPDALIATRAASYIDEYELWEVDFKATPSELKKKYMKPLKKEEKEEKEEEEDKALKAGKLTVSEIGDLNEILDEGPLFGSDWMDKPPPQISGSVADFMEVAVSEKSSHISIPPVEALEPRYPKIIQKKVINYQKKEKRLFKDSNPNYPSNVRELWDTETWLSRIKNHYLRYMGPSTKKTRKLTQWEEAQLLEPDSKFYSNFKAHEKFIDFELIGKKDKDIRIITYGLFMGGVKKYAIVPKWNIFKSANYKVLAKDIPLFLPNFYEMKQGDVKDWMKIFGLEKTFDSVLIGRTNQAAKLKKTPRNERDIKKFRSGFYSELYRYIHMFRAPYIRHLQVKYLNIQIKKLHALQEDFTGIFQRYNNYMCSGAMKQAKEKAQKEALKRKKKLGAAKLERELVQERERMKKKYGEDIDLF